MELASKSKYSEVAEFLYLNAESKTADLEMKELNDLNNELKIADSVKLPLKSGCCIYKVPPKLRKLNNEAYTPTVVSIGPYHFGDKRLKSMQELKVWYVNRFLKRNSMKSLQDYLEALKYQEHDIRSSYSETIQMQNDDFVRMIFTDACFIIEFFLACEQLVQDPSVGMQDPLVGKLWPTSDIELDLILLENQLPFFVLTLIFDMAFPWGVHGKLSFVELTFRVFEYVFFPEIYPKKGTPSEYNSFLKLAFDAFVNVFSLRICSKRETDQHRNEERNPKFMKNFNHNSLDQVKHLCDVLRRFYIPTTDTPTRESDPAKTCSHSASQLHEAGMDPADDIESGVTKQEYSETVLKIPRIGYSEKPYSHSASQLHEAGMKFQADIESGVPKLNYSEGVLKIPRIVVSDWTETMLRNVVALEQCHYPGFGYATDYVCLLDDLIDTEKDVKILVEKKIMENLLGDSNELASMVNKLCINVMLTNINKEYISLYKDMDKFCEKTCNCHKYMAIFMREYWSTPWKIASVIAATVLLVLTFLQTIFSGISL